MELDLSRAGATRALSSGTSAPFAPSASFAPSEFFAPFAHLDVFAHLAPFAPLTCAETALSEGL
ncbi:MAG: hypothetical protein JW986_04155 [Methanotrichaceae archaeon]|nr:hypothetical protein [Methanotrichaceae archaeon]